MAGGGGSSGGGEAWAITGTVPDRSADEWLSMVSDYRQRGITFARVHLFPARDQLNDYCRYVLDSYGWNVSAGEAVSIADRATSPELERLDRDFWVIDDRVVVLDYNDDRSFRGAYIADGHEAEDRLEHRRLAEEWAVDLSTYQEREHGRLTG